MSWLFVPGPGGNFLDPPTWPTHTTHIEERIGHNKQAFMSLTYAMECEYVPPATRAEAKRRIDEARKNLPPLSDHAIIVWCATLENYFRNCYSRDGVDHNADHCIIRKRYLRNHSLAVLYIKQFYPKYRINQAIRDAMATAPWGRK